MLDYNFHWGIKQTKIGRQCLCKFQRWICWFLELDLLLQGELIGFCQAAAPHFMEKDVQQRIISIETIGICIVVCVFAVFFLCVCMRCKHIFPTGMNILKDNICFPKLFFTLLIVCFYPQIGVGLLSSLPPSFNSTYVNTATGQLTNDSASPGGPVSIYHRPQSRRVCRNFFICSRSFYELWVFFVCFFFRTQHLS